MATKTYTAKSHQGDAVDENNRPGRFLTMPCNGRGLLKEVQTYPGGLPKKHGRRSTKHQTTTTMTATIVEGDRNLATCGP
jgi:hypothetical protein